MDKYTWNLKEIYEDESKLEWDIGELYGYMGELKNYKGKLSLGVDEVYNCYKILEKSLEHFERISVYAMMKFHQDMSNQENIKLYKRIERITAEFSEVESFILPEMSKIDDKTLESFLEDPRMLEYEKIIKDIIKSKKHILSEEVEEVLAKFSEVFASSENVFDIFTNTELEYKEIIDKDGKYLKMNASLYSVYLMSKDEDIRKQAFESLYEIYKKHINTITELYLTRVKQSTIASKLRNYKSSLDAATDNDDSNIEVYKTLVSQMNRFLYLNHDYLKLKSKLLEKEKLNMYDVYVNMLDTDGKEIEYEQAKQLVLEGLAPLGKEYIDILKQAFDNNWIDVYEKENKKSGAYSVSMYNLHPFVLLNYISTSRDVSTIAHELGHSMHSYYACKNQNVINANYTIMVAEVASTVNEILLANYLINKETDSKRKAALINEQLDTIRATLIRQTMFAEFEEIVHSRIENGESLNSDGLNEIYYELIKKYFGEGCIINDEIKYEWARIPHFYSCFYVYKYATGITSAIVIASKILSREEGYVDKYINMLSQGGSKDSLELLRMVDVDLEKAETYEEAFKYFEKNLEELKKLI